MLQILNGKITQYKLPTTGTLSDGRTVSGYHLLDIEILKGEGWLPLEDKLPSYDENTQYLINDGYEILEDRVVKKYKVEDKTEPQPTEIDLLNARIQELESTIDIMLGGEVVE